MNHRKTLLVTALLVAGATFAVGSFAQTATPSRPRPRPRRPRRATRRRSTSWSPRPSPQIKTIKMPEFKAAFDKKDLGLIVDVRNENEFEDGFVPGAVNVPRGLIEFRIWKLVGFPDKTDMAKKMTLYCASGGRCALATKTLHGAGLHQRHLGRHDVRRLGEGRLSGREAEEVAGPALHCRGRTPRALRPFSLRT